MNDSPLTLIQARDAIASKAKRSAVIVREAFDRAAQLEPSLHCFLQLFEEQAMDDAARVDDAINRGDPVGPLAGVPIAVKDNLCLSYGRTTCGSRFLEEYQSPFTATAPQRLIDAGAVILGKTNLDEFAMGSSTENSAFGPTRNPWDISRVPGGSSGGSAAAVAAEIVPGALGSDTGGSVRQPAALCGVVGFKPTYGRVSRWGLVAYASSLDQIGTIAHTVGDAALLYQVISGHDPNDSTSAKAPVPDVLESLRKPLQPLRIGVPKQARSASNHPSVAAAFDQSIESLRSLGAQIVDIDLPHLEYGVPAYYLVATAEASSNLARFDGVRYGRRAKLNPGEAITELYARSRAEGFGDEVQRRIMLGTYALSSGYYDAYYLSALKVRQLIKQDFDRAFAHDGAGCHAIITPSTVNPAFKIGAHIGDPLAMYLEDLYTVTANLAGIPAISVPCGFAEIDGVSLPLGLQLLAPAYHEADLLRIAAMFEEARASSGAPVRKRPPRL